MALNKKIFSLTLNPETIAEVDRKARDQGRSRSNFIENELNKKMMRKFKIPSKKNLRNTEIGIKEADKDLPPTTRAKMKANWKDDQKGKLMN